MAQCSNGTKVSPAISQVVLLLEGNKYSSFYRVCNCENRGTLDSLPFVGGVQVILNVGSKFCCEMFDNFFFNDTMA
jgi:hypothetical protein